MLPPLGRRMWASWCLRRLFSERPALVQDVSGGSVHECGQCLLRGPEDDRDGCHFSGWHGLRGGGECRLKQDDTGQGGQCSGRNLESDLCELQADRLRRAAQVA
jgi:hypothetical protein